MMWKEMIASFLYVKTLQKQERAESTTVFALGSSSRTGITISFTMFQYGLWFFAWCQSLFQWYVMHVQV